MKDVIDQAPKIIAAAAKSPLGIVALMILALSFLGYLFFASASEAVKIAMFCLMFSGYALLGYNLISRSAAQSQTAKKRSEAAPPTRQVEAQLNQPVIEEPAPERYLPAGRCQRRLMWILTVGTIVPATLIVLQLLLGKYTNDDATGLWAWIVPMGLPPISVMIGALAFDAIIAKQSVVLNRFAYRVAVKLSLVFSFFLLATVLCQPFVAFSPLEFLSVSTIWLAPLQGVLMISLSVLFLSKR